MKRFLILFIAIILLSCQSAPLKQKDSPTSKKWLLEKLGGTEFAISRSYLNGFEKLSPSEKIKLYYLSRAAIAGRDIYYDQRHRDAVRIRNFFESLLSEKKISKPLQEKIQTYLKYIWMNNSQYHARTGVKFAPHFTLKDLQAVLPKKDLTWLQDTVFNKNFEPVLTNLTPKPEEGDILKASANNIYSPNIQLDDLKTLDKSIKSKLNLRFQKNNGKVIPQIYKFGEVYGEELKRVAHFLKKAAQYSKGKQKSGLEKLISYYESGDEEMFRQSCIDWLQSKPTVDTINGFIESYMDPRQTVGSWEGIAYYTSSDPVLKNFSENAQYFEKNMPWNDIYKRSNFDKAPVATLINVAVAIGEAGPITWSGINLPNYQDIRSQHGSKNVVLSNMIEARSQVSKNIKIKEFYLPKYQPMIEKHMGTAYKMLLYMHEVTGHGSGQASKDLKGDPRDHIGKNYGAWEEARASLVAYHHIVDDKLIELGAFSKKDQNDVIETFYLKEFTDQLLNLTHAAHEDVLREPHDRADQMIFEYIRQNFGGFDVIEKDGKFYVDITDVKAIHKGASQLLKIVHEAKATGDKKTVDSYLTKYGNHFNVNWRDNMIARGKKVGLPEQTAIVFATLIPKFKDGQISDVILKNKESFSEQQLRFGKISKTTEVSDNLY